MTSVSDALMPTIGMMPHEVDVLRLLTEGLDARQISEKFAYSERPVKNGQPGPPW
ncbi:hypothetical protein OG530_30675 [Streptomyces decoyicus]|uniref:hypothetical protein n=1 Tax=Streptomyces decoyicus TaxID=249567 RepID=UPI002E173B01